MSSQSPIDSSDLRLWIVLVQKSPKGPFTLAEVCELIDKGVVRRNDPAMKLGKETGKSSGSWKLLYQYEEFERRTPQPLEPTLLGTFSLPKEGERRKVEAENEARALDDAVPLDLADIQPEDLIQTTSRELHRSGDSAEVEVGFTTDSGRPTEEDPGGSRWMVGGMFLLLIMGLFAWGSRSTWFSFSRSKPQATGLSPSLQDEAIPNPDLDEGVAPRRLSSRPNVVQPVFRAPVRPPRQAVLPTQREPEPPSRREESRFDRAADSDLSRSGDTGEIRDEREEEPDDVDRAERSDEAPPPKRKFAKEKSKAAVSEEEEPSPNSENASGNDSNTDESAKPQNTDEPSNNE